MNATLWVVAALLAVVYVAVGSLKLSRSKEQLVAAGMGFVEDLPTGAVKAIGALEVLAAIGLILPAALDIAPLLTPLAAAGLVALMVGAVATNVRRGDYPKVASDLVLLLLAAVLAWARFGPYAF